MVKHPNILVRKSGRYELLTNWDGPPSGWVSDTTKNTIQALEDSRRRTRSKNNEEWSVPEEEPATWLVKDRVMEC